MRIDGARITPGKGSAERPARETASFGGDPAGRAGTHRPAPPRRT